jgi:hypothetical protein
MNDPIERFGRFEIYYVPNSWEHLKLRAGNFTMEGLDNTVLVVNVSLAQKQQCGRVYFAKPVYRRR